MSVHGFASRVAAALCVLVAGLGVVSACAWAAPAVDPNCVIGTESVNSANCVTAVTDVMSTSVDIHSAIDPMGAETSYFIEYGQSASYGARVPASDINIGAGTEAVPIVARVSGLTPDTSYHYRVVATSVEGVSDGLDHQFRTQPLATPFVLPDNRAYEMVSPVDKNGGGIRSDVFRTRSAPDGNAVSFASLTAFGDSGGSASLSDDYIARRGPDGWTTHGLSPDQPAYAYPAPTIEKQTSYVEYNRELTKGVIRTMAPIGSAPNVEGYGNLYLRTNLAEGGPTQADGASYELLSDSVNPLPPFNESHSNKHLIGFVTASADFKHILFESFNNLTLEAEEAHLSSSEPKLYEWDEGIVRLAGILPDGEPATPSSGSGNGQATTNSSYAHTANMISADGSRVFFITGADGLFTPADHVYARDNHATTIQLDLSERTVPVSDPNPPAVELVGASTDGNIVFFSTNENLTDEDINGTCEAEEGFSGGHARFSGPCVDLYRYDFSAPAGHHLTMIGNYEEVLGVSADGSYIYFESPSMLVPGQTVLSSHPDGLSRYAIYVWHDGAIRVIGGFSGDEHFGLSADENARVTPDGQYFLFRSNSEASEDLTGYDNQGPGCEGENSCNEVYLYHYQADKLVCVSCNPTGEPPALAAASLTSKPFENPGASFTGEKPFSVAQTSSYRTNAITEDGDKVFFDTPEALVPGDTNGRRDVYQYDTASGQLHLISTGTCACESYFVEANPDGSDVFFTTVQRLVRIDIDNQVDLYDARVNGGIAAQNAVAPLPCEGDDCQGPAPSPPLLTIPSSATFAGSGNLRMGPLSAKSKPKRKPARKKLAKQRHKRRAGHKGHKGGRSAKRSQLRHGR